MAAIDEMIFFKDKEGNIVYNEKCIKCEKDCKQSHKAIVVICPKFAPKKK